ncbi:hypothetical protein ATANTOWER_025916, partial [Ataeniobius toweri]|nr:hypothetical protein [Ataeniobius toweri]
FPCADFRLTLEYPWTSSLKPSTSSQELLDNLLHSWQPSGSSFPSPLCNLFAIQCSGQDSPTSPVSPLSFSATHTRTKSPDSAHSSGVIICSYHSQEGGVHS